MILSFEALKRSHKPSRFARAHLFLSLSLIFLFSVLHTSLRAQDDSDIETVRVRTDLVTVPAFVTDARGRRVQNLTAADFELRDDGRAVKIEYFAAGTERVALVFALDASGSAQQIISQQRETALALFSRFGRASEVAVLRFAEQAELAAPFSGAPSDALKAFELPALRNHRTAIFDAAASSIKTFETRRADATERRIVILISDGLDTVSRARPRDVINAARQSGVSFYVIQIPLYAPRGGRLAPRPASKGFRELAEETGGRYFMAGDARAALAAQPSYDLAPIFQAIEEDLQGQYLLGYYQGEETPQGAGRSHRLSLSLTSKDKRKLRVRLLREAYNLNQ
ncbi:MAG: VWA domain-containing protein [Acidobacteria bacterium]|nr:VWA domain-containing protein [Acidobacteriota bacterium]